MTHKLGSMIAQKRHELGYTQQKLADLLNISFQAVSKWENGTASPDISLLPRIARILGTSVDSLLGYTSHPLPYYEMQYQQTEYYWGLAPNRLCYEIMKLRPPVKPYRVLDIGCGEGKDAVFLARNGYQVTAFDIAESGLVKARELAARNKVKVDFFKANLLDYTPDTTFDIVFCSGVLHYLPPALRTGFFDRLKEHTHFEGIHVLNVFVDKPFIAPPPDDETREPSNLPWRSGELFTCYHDWLLHKNEESIFDCHSGGIPHKHCMDVLIAEKLPSNRLL